MFVSGFFCIFFISLALNKGVLALSVTKKETWQPTVSSLEERQQLRGLSHHSETIRSKGFHHVEFYCGDAKSTANQFCSSLGMTVVGSSSQSTGNDKCVSYGLASGDFQLLLTAPYSRAINANGVAGGGGGEVQYDAPEPLPGFDLEFAHDFFQRHGLAARAIGLLVDDAKIAFDESVRNGAVPVLDPTFVETCNGQVQNGVESSGCNMSEVKLYGDVVLRFVSFPDQKRQSHPQATKSASLVPFLPHLAPMPGKIIGKESFGIHTIDHAVGNVYNLLETYTYIKNFTGFHEFAEFTSEDVGTVDSGLNSVVLASDSENVLLPLNEPTDGQ